MIINYSNEEIKKGKESIFLAGPTLRQNSKNNMKSWRIEALDILEELNYKGIVYIPEYSDFKTKESYIKQADWEVEALESASKIIFWIPRDLKVMPGFTTNVEFGLFVKSNKVFLGYPIGTPKMQYLKYWYEKIYHKTPFSNLKELLTNVVKQQ